jgi:transcriptional regulator
MYQPAHFEQTDAAAIARLLAAHPLATLVWQSADGLSAEHVPLLFDRGDADGAHGTLRGHVARANALWREGAGQPVMAVFQGTQAYVSPSWYPSKAAHGKVVPTWNYAVVHAHGTAEIVDDRDWLVRHVGELTDQQEVGTPTPWATSDAPGNFIEVMSRGIVGMRFTIDRLEGKAKLSQNRELPDRAGVVAGLKASGAENDAKVADLVVAAAEKGQ